jgi:hypothetical protein
VASATYLRRSLHALIASTFAASKIERPVVEFPSRDEGGIPVAGIDGSIGYQILRQYERGGLAREICRKILVSQNEGLSFALSRSWPNNCGPAALLPKDGFSTRGSGAWAIDERLAETAVTRRP